jgi:predicted nucleic acid-binding protein
LNYIFDACALIAYIKAEPGEDIVRGLLSRAKAGEITLYMSVFNLLEVCYGFYKEIGAKNTVILKQKLYSLPVTIIEYVSAPVFDAAFRLKASYRCSLADAVGLATTIDLSGQFVTSDHHELEEIERHETISFVWLPPHPRNPPVIGKDTR